MTTLNLHTLPDAVYRRLRLRAAKSGRSIEAEARAILVAACGNETDVMATELQDFVDRLYGEKKPVGVVDALIEERRCEGKAGA